MRKTTSVMNDNMITVNMAQLQAMLGVGRNTADKIGKESGAVIHIGRRKLFNVSKIQKYLDNISEEVN